MHYSTLSITLTWSPRMLTVIGIGWSYNSILTSSLVSETFKIRAFSPLKAPVIISTIHPTSIPDDTAFG